MEVLKTIRANPKKSFIYFLSASYFVGFALHTLDVFGLRLDFSHLSELHQKWIIALLVGDFLTAVLLLKKPIMGIVLFHIVAISQLVAYWGYQDIFGRQDFLIVFHVLTLAIYWKIFAREQVRRHG